VAVAVVIARPFLVRIGRSAAPGTTVGTTVTVVVARSGMKIFGTCVVVLTTVVAFSRTI
jgi:hypothetical protein